MLWFYESFFPVLWIAFLIYWPIKAANTETTRRLEPAASRILRALIFLIAIALFSTTRILLHWLYLQPWTTGLWPFWLGAAVMIVGVLFAVWAREQLGRNWSRAVTIKQGHELITTGPYALARHPIYTGILVGMLGTATALSQICPSHRRLGAIRFLIATSRSTDLQKWKQILVLRVNALTESNVDAVAVGTIITDRPPHRSARALISACGSYLG